MTNQNETPSPQPAQPISASDRHPYVFIQAKNCGPVRTGLELKWVVIHTMEAAEKPGTARAVGEWFGGPQAPQASAHYGIDGFGVVQYVDESVVAWAAPGANKLGIHLEHAGFAGQNAAQWGDDYSRAVLVYSAALAADICRRNNIPAVRLSVEELQAGKKGFCGHVDVTNAFNNGHGHQDPGPNFPWSMYMAMVVSFIETADQGEDIRPIPARTVV